MPKNVSIDEVSEMKRPSDFTQILIHRDPVDMRKQALGLSQLISETFGNKSFNPDKLYIFSNKRKKILKCLYWDKTGFALWTKILDQAIFPWPKKYQTESVTISAEQLAWLLEGVDIWKLKKHEALSFERVF